MPKKSRQPEEYARCEPDESSIRVSRRFAESVPGSPHQARALVVEGPPRNEELHRGGIIARAEAVLPVERMRCVDCGAVDLDAETRLIRDRDAAAADFQRLAGERL